MAIGTAGFEGLKYHLKPGISWECLDSFYTLFYSFLFLRKDIDSGQVTSTWRRMGEMLRKTIKDSKMVQATFPTLPFAFPCSQSLSPTRDQLHSWPFPLSLVSKAAFTLQMNRHFTTTSWFMIHLKEINSNKFDSNPIFFLSRRVCDCVHALPLERELEI